MTWQPIEIVNLDKNKRIVWAPNEESDESYYRDDEHGHVYIATFYNNGWWKTESGMFVKPTHWMPLPEPPK